ncbi:MAG: hypothetical protein OEX02_14000 [Cyclobacteriaceae bacterium]|nr:hypothetical protein [Cyclobacteriaceae bacterium]
MRNAFLLTLAGLAPQVLSAHPALEGHAHDSIIMDVLGYGMVAGVFFLLYLLGKKALKMR